MIPLLVYGDHLDFESGLRQWQGLGGLMVGGPRKTTGYPTDRNLRRLFRGRGEAEANLAARVVAVTGRQIEIELPSELAAGSPLWIAGEVHGLGLSVAIQGQVRVLACQPCGPGRFRAQLTPLSVQP